MMSNETQSGEIPSVGVVGISPGCATDLKRELLLFDRLATVLRTARVDHPEYGKSVFVRDQAEEDAFRQRLSDAKFLASHGLAFAVDDVSIPTELKDDPVVRELHEEYSSVNSEICAEVPVGTIRTYKEI